MSEIDEGIEFEGGFFGEAGIDATEVPDDPFGFGNDFWPLVCIEVGQAKVTANKDKIGMMVKFAVDHPKFQGAPVGEKLGNGNWYQLPVPLALREQIPWDPEGDKEKKALYNLGELFKAMGFPKDQWKSVNGKKMVGRRISAKIKATKDDNGFWQFRLNQMKEIDGGADSNWSGGTPAGNTESKSAADLLKEELGGA
jgi:hypothetical protein